MLEVLAHRSFLGSRSLVLLLALFSLLPHYIAGQITVNGQTFTNGLAVIDAPSSSNPGHAGSSINIAVDVSGNGKLSPAASIPGSGLPTSYESLEIYLVSAQTNINMTVAAGPAFLTGESGSTVKHLNWPIPQCIPAGNYNLTLYEISHFNGQEVFTITPIPIPISNPGASAQCPGLNPLQPQPQDSKPLPQSPFAPGSASPWPPSSSGFATVIGVPQSSAVILTLTVSGGVLELPTITVTASAKPTPTTVVLVSTATLTETAQGKITTYIQATTITTVVSAVPGPTGQANSDTSDFIPVNAAARLIISMPLCLFFGAWTLFCVLVY